MEKGNTILIADDNRAILKVLTKRFQKINYRILPVENGQDVISALETEQVDLVLMDEMMPQMTGTETLKEINARFPDLPPVIMMTAHGSIELAVSFMKNGGEDFVIKPIDFDVLLLKVRKTLINRQTRKKLQEAQIAREIIEQVSQFKEDLLNSTQHEFRTPLGIVHANIQTALKDKNLSAKTGEYLRDSLKIVNQQVHLHDKLNKAAQVGSATLELKTINLKDFYQKVITTGIVVDQNERIKVVVGIDPELSVRADEGALSYVMVNLLENALKFTTEGQIQILANETSSNVVISISDTGMGIDQEHHARIFSKMGKIDLQTGKYPGLGVGLYTSKVLLEKMAGSIWLESELGLGSTFYFSLPKKH